MTSGSSPAIACPLLGCSTDSDSAILGALAQRPSLHSLGLILGSFLLRDNLAGIKFDEHSSIRLDFLHGYGEAEVVQEEKLQLQMVELWEGKAANLVDTLVLDELPLWGVTGDAHLGIARVCIENIRKEFTRACHAGYD